MIFEIIGFLIVAMIGCLILGAIGGVFLFMYNIGTGYYDKDIVAPDAEIESK